jgi:hypothetical protein
MEKAEILKRLESCIDIENGMVSDGFKFIQLKNELLEDVKKEACKRAGTKTSKLNAIKRVLKVQEKLRPLLSKYIIEDGKMVFTDSYQAFMIDDLENNPFPKVGENDGVYPNVKNCFPEFDDSFVDITLDEATIRAMKKTTKNNRTDRQKNTYKLENVDTKITFDTYLLVNMLDIMPKDTKYYFAKGTMIYGISESTGDKCITLGIRNY